MALSGNKGEWSEAYVFLKLLAEGKLHAADANLNIIPNVYYPIIKILRNELNTKRDYSIGLNSNIEVINADNGNVIISVNVQDFIDKSRELFTNLRRATGRSFSFPDIETFLSNIDVKSLTAISSNKADIRLVVHDLNTGLTPTLGFSIKSMLGKNSTLFNPGATTNFIYEIKNSSGSDAEFLSINNINNEPKIRSRINRITEIGGSIEFLDIASKNLKLNLQLIDSHLPSILGNLLLYKYSEQKSNLRELLNIINDKNPLNFDLSLGHPFYEYKIKNFLTDSALGMTPATLWTGKYDANGGIIIVKENGDVVCYHIYNRNEFQDYLINNTRLEQASTSRYEFGDVYCQNGKRFIKLNLQVRFD
ncbi:MAG: HpaII family restriction endonuclease [Chitinophagales bacterium]|nr:HpaII family restriction endonuclease [Chitinophagales bacterium]